MDNNPSSYFPRRGDENGTFDLICPHCFRTIACGVKEPDIAELEQAIGVGTEHGLCSSKLLTKYSEQNQ